MERRKKVVANWLRELADKLDPPVVKLVVEEEAEYDWFNEGNFGERPV
jgi:hypothetical protein